MLAATRSLPRRKFEELSQESMILTNLHRCDRLTLRTGRARETRCNGASGVIFANSRGGQSSRGSPSHETLDCKARRAAIRERARCVRLIFKTLETTNTCGTRSCDGSERQAVQAKHFTLVSTSTSLSHAVCLMQEALTTTKKKPCANQRVAVPGKSEWISKIRASCQWRSAAAVISQRHRAFRRHPNFRHSKPKRHQLPF